MADCSAGSGAASLFSYLEIEFKKQSPKILLGHQKMFTRT
jgi:hypothetical protein